MLLNNKIILHHILNVIWVFAHDMHTTKKLLYLAHDLKVLNDWKTFKVLCSPGR